MINKRSELGDNIGRGRKVIYQREFPGENMEGWIEKPNQEHKTGNDLVWFIHQSSGKLRGIIAAARYTNILKEHDKKFEQEVAEAVKRFSGKK